MLDRAQKRCQQRRALRARVVVPIPPELRAQDPLNHPRTKSAAIRIVGLVVGALVVHAATVGALGAMARVAKNGAGDKAKNSKIKVALVQEPEVPPPPPAPPPEKEPEKEAKLEPPAPKKRPKKKKKPPPKTPVAFPEPQTQKPPPKKKAPPPRRIVGLSLESTVGDGSGPAFATGNTRLGTTKKRAEAPKVVKAQPAIPVAVPEGSNKSARWLPGVGGEISKPKRIKRIKPRYPEVYRARNIETDVLVEVELDVKGRVVRASVVKPSKHQAFNEAALRAAKAEQFSPAMKDGRPISFRLRFTYRFRLSD